MRTIISTIKYNLDTNFSQNLSFFALGEKCPNAEFFSGPYLGTFHAVSSYDFLH